LRDLGWLSQRGDRKKGIDIVGPVVAVQGDDGECRLKHEEHNMGKLMRILSETGIEERFPKSFATDPSAENYRRFKTFTITQGLMHNARRLLDLSGITGDFFGSFEHSPNEIRSIAKATTSRGNLLIASTDDVNDGKKRAFAKNLSEDDIEECYVWLFNSKFSWWVYHFAGNQLRPVRRDDKLVQGKKLMKGSTALRSLLKS
jgi:hypothetical protein